MERGDVQQAKLMDQHGRLTLCIEVIFLGGRQDLFEKNIYIYIYTYTHITNPYRKELEG